MSRLLTPHAWQKQPQHVVPLDPRFPKPAFLYVPSLGSIDLTNTTRKGTKGASDNAWAPRDDLITYQTADATNAGLDFGTLQAVSDALSIVVVAKAASGAGICTLWSQRSSVSPFNQMELLLNSTHSLAVNAGGFAMTSFNSSFYGSHTGSGRVDDKWHVYGAVRTGGSSPPTLWWDGQKPSLTSTAGSISTAVSASQKTRIGNLGDYSTDANYVGVANIAFVGVWEGVLPEEVMRALTTNPWQIFKPAQRRFLEHVSGGATSVNCTLGTAAALGYQAGVSQDTNIAASLGAAVAEGFQATIATGTQIACALGSAVAEGFQSAVATSTVIACAIGTADATGFQAAVDVGGSTMIVCATGTADASGIAASVAQETVIACAIGTATALGRTATVSVGGTGTGATVEEIWSYEIEPGVTAKVAMQRILAVLGGKVSGAGSGTETFRDINDTRDALVSVNDSSGNRTSITWTDGA